MNSLSYEWSNSTVSDSANLIHRKPVPYKGTKPYVATADVQGYNIIPSELVSYFNRPSRADVLVQANDIIQAKMRGTNKAVKISQDNSGWLFSTGFALFNPELVGNSSDFFYHFIQSEYFLHMRDLFSVGSTQQAISDKDLKKIKIIFPSNKNVQQKIAEILSTIDTAIEKTDSLIKKYKQIKTGLMHDLFTRGLTPDGKLRPSREEAPQLYKETKIGWIPKEWELKPIGKIANFQRGYDIIGKDFNDGKYPVVSSGGILGFHNEFTTIGPNVIIGRKGTIGKVHYVETNFWAHDTSLFVTDFFGNNVKFVYYLCNFLDLARYGTRSGSPSLNRNDFHPVEIGCPLNDEQISFVDRINVFDQFISVNECDLNKLINSKLGLMHDLLTGNREVKIETEETAND